MTGKTHRVIGIIAGSGYFLSSVSADYQPATLGAIIIASYLGSLIPDADNASADIWDTLPLGHTVGKITDPFIGHRGFSHSLIGIVAYSIIVYLILKSAPVYWGISTTPVLISSILAYSSHLFVDMFTVEGIPLFWPWRQKFGIPPKPFDGIRIETGKWFENIVIFSLVDIILIILIYSNWSTIKSLIYK